MPANARRCRSESDWLHTNFPASGMLPAYASLPPSSPRIAPRLPVKPRDTPSIMVDWPDVGSVIAMARMTHSARHTNISAMTVTRIRLNHGPATTSGPSPPALSATPYVPATPGEPKLPFSEPVGACPFESPSSIGTTSTLRSSRSTTTALAVFGCLIDWITSLPAAGRTAHVGTMAPV